MDVSTGWPDVVKLGSSIIKTIIISMLMNTAFEWIVWLQIHYVRGLILTSETRCPD